MLKKSKFKKSASAVAKVRVPDHTTSVAASETVARRITSLMATVHKAIKKSGTRGLTDSEVTLAIIAAGHPEAPDSTYRKRRTELTQLGHVKWNGARRRNPKGSMEKVWVISDVPLPVEDED